MFLQVFESLRVFESFHIFHILFNESTQLMAMALFYLNPFMLKKIIKRVTFKSQTLLKKNLPYVC